MSSAKSAMSLFGIARAGNWACVQALQLRNAHVRLASSYSGKETTIFAPVSGGLPSAVAIVRISGPDCRKVVQQLGKFRKTNFLVPRSATLKKLYDPSTQSVLDKAMVLWFPKPNSYTGEDCCEFHIHGSRAVMNSLLRSLNSFPECRMAEPGEFTRRAFLNGKMDLTEVEGLGDLISSETEMQRIQALKQMSGSLGKLYEDWRRRIGTCLAHVEAYIDFAEDENIEGDVLERVSTEVKKLVNEIESHLQDSRKGEKLRSGVKLAIIGRPNAGKSSLLNVLCQRDAAIVSSIAGTTRDVLTATINIGGYPVNLADTAGLRPDPENVIEIEGIRRAVKEAEESDLIVLLIDVSGRREEMLPPIEELGKRSIQQPLDRHDFIRLHLKQMVPDPEDVVNSLTSHPNMILVGNKLDLFAKIESKLDFLSQFDATLSCTTLQGYDGFYGKLVSNVSQLCANPVSEAPHLTQERHRNHLRNCLQHLRDYSLLTESTLATAGEPQVVDLSLEVLPLKYAVNSIGCITGHYGTEDILDIIFKEFCIGK